jgi:hypothetical protein
MAFHIDLGACIIKTYYNCNYFHSLVFVTGRPFHLGLIIIYSTLRLSQLYPKILGEEETRGTVTDKHTSLLLFRIKYCRNSLTIFQFLSNLQMDPIR